MRKQDQKCWLEMTTANGLEPVLVFDKDVCRHLPYSRKNYD